MRPKKTIFISIVLGLIFLILGLLVWYFVNIQPISKTESRIKFIITPNESFDSVASNLEEKGLIRSKLAFKIMSLREGITGKVQAGSFQLSPSQTAGEIAQELTLAKPDEVWIRVLEGWRREEIANHIDDTLKQNNISFNKNKFLELTQGKEGYLFPDSYLISPDSTETSIASLLENTFEKKVTSQMRSDLEKQGKSLNEVVTMASLIEREARKEDARGMVSGILWKRNSNGWPLQVDATLQYVKGYDKKSKSWWSPPQGRDKELDSAYNTYKNLGLPPASIASPSLSSLKAAIYPISSEYWFYITSNDGKMYYAKNLQEHNVNIDKYLR